MSIFSDRTFSVINLTLNVVPAVVSYKFIGKKFTMYSCLMIVVSGLIPASCCSPLPLSAWHRDWSSP